MLYINITRIVGIFLLIICQIFADNSTFQFPENTTTPTLFNSYDSSAIYSVEYKITQNKLPDLLFDLINRYPYNNFINSEDVLNLLNFQNFTSTLSLTEIDFDKLIKMSGISVNAIRAILTTYIPPRKITNLRKIIEGFNIDFDEYQEYVLENDDFRLFQLLKTGNYTDNSVQYALTTMDKNEKEILQIIWPMFFEKLTQLPLPTLLNSFHSEITYFFSDINKTLVSVSQNPGFTLMLKNFTDSLNNETIWSTAISPTELITIFKVGDKVQLFNEFIDVYITEIGNNDVSLIGNVVVNNAITIIQVQEDLESYINKEVNYLTDIDNCYHVVQTAPQNITFVDVDDIFYENSRIITNNKVIQNLGSPLICDGLLYGFLIDQNQTNLIYYSFKEIAKPINSGAVSILEPGQSEYAAGVSGVSKLCLNIVLVAVAKSIIFIEN